MGLNQEAASGGACPRQETKTAYAAERDWAGGSGGEPAETYQTSSCVALKFPHRDGSAGLLGQEKKDPGTEGVPGSPEKIGRGSLIRIVSHPLDLTLPKIAGPFRGGLMKGEAFFACSTFSP